MPRITITVPDQVAQPYRFSLERQIVHFGRGDDNDVFIDSGSVSSEHCVMERIIGGYVLKDLGSTNGIKLNAERVETISLRNGQDIHIGDCIFGFELNEEEITALRLEDPTSSLPPLTESPTKGSKSSSDDQAPAAVDLKAEPKQDLPEIKKLDPEPQKQVQPEPLPEIQPQQQIQPEPQPHQQIQPEPQIQAAPQQVPATTVMGPQDNSGFNKLVTALGVVAFLVGIAVRFQKKTGDSILTALMEKLG